MLIVSIASNCGGVGKTALTANLGAELALRGRRVLLIDLDAQASLTHSFIVPNGLSGRYEGCTIKAWLAAHGDDIPVTFNSLIASPARVSQKLQGRGSLNIIPAGTGLIDIEIALTRKLVRASFRDAESNFCEVHNRFLFALNSLAGENLYDVVLIDCPSSLNVFTKSALVASDYILVPTCPDALSMLRIKQLTDSIRRFISDYDAYVAHPPSADFILKRPPMVAVVFTMVQEYYNQPVSAQRQYISQIRREARVRIFDSYIKRNDMLFSEAMQYGIPVVLTSRNNFSRRGVIAGFKAVTTELATFSGLELKH